jgi:hypothetical protein
MNYTFLLVLAVFLVFIAAPVLIVAAVLENRRRNALRNDDEEVMVANLPREHVRHSITGPAGATDLHRHVLIAFQHTETTTHLPNNVLPRSEVAISDARQWPQEVLRALDWSTSRSKEQVKA